MNLQVVEDYLERAMNEFGTSRLATQLIRRLGNETPDLFYLAAVKYLNTNDQSDAHRLLTVVLLRQESLLNHLTDTIRTPSQCSVNLFRRMLAIDPSMDVKLARRLPARNSWNQGDALDSIRSARALDILDETSRGRRLLPVLSHLPDSMDDRISAKATLFVGRRLQNPHWAERQLKRSDQRVRANAVEGLWGLDTSPAMHLLDHCASDRNCRVAGNALVGLHIAGRDDATSEVMTRARMAEPEMRATAAWAMGKMAQDRFIAPLKMLVRDEQPAVRSIALRSLFALRRLEPKAIAIPEPGPAEPLVERAREVLLPAPPASELTPDFALSLNGLSFAIGHRRSFDRVPAGEAP